MSATTENLPIHPPKPPSPSTIFTQHNRALRHYKDQLAQATTRIASLEAQLKKTQSALNEEIRSMSWWKERVTELDRRTRIQDLETTAALRGKREAEMECARLRVELEVERQRLVARPGVNLNLPPQRPTTNTGTANKKLQTEDLGDERMKEQAIRGLVHALWNSQASAAIAARQCECGAARALRRLYPMGPQRGRTRTHVLDNPAPDVGVVNRADIMDMTPPDPREERFERQRKRELRLKLKATKDRVESIRCENRQFEHMVQEVDMANGETWDMGLEV